MNINFTNTARETLVSGKIAEAISVIYEETLKAGMNDISEKALKLQNDYRLLLDYFASGAKDPTRQDMLAQIINRVYLLIDTIRYYLSPTENDEAIPEIEISNKEKLFKAVVNNFPATKADRKAIQQIILNDEHPLYMRGMVLGALTLNLLNYFDNEKFESLYAYTLDDQPIEIQARAWVAIVLVTMKHDVRISTQPRLVEQMRFLCEEGCKEGEPSPLLAVQTALVQSLRGKDVRDILRGEIASSLDKGLREIRQQTDDEEELAPKLEEFMEESGIQDKIQDFINLQRKGVDIMYESFVHMKNVAFFKEESNWFLPFDIEHPVIKLLMETSEAKANYVKIISKAGNMCSTDKFSNLFMTTMIPDSQFEQVQTALKGSNVSVENMLDTTLEDEIVGYVHDLFRYYTLFKTNNKEDYDPFSRSLFFGSYIGLADVMSGANEMKMLAELLIDGKNWSEAVNVLTLLEEADSSEKNMQLLTHCLNKRDGDHVESLPIISKCHAFYPNNKWTMKNYAKSLNAVGDFSAEEKILREGCEIFPDDIGFIVALAQSLMDQGRYEEAMEQLFKANLKKENSYRTCSYLAECALLLGNKEIAERFIEKTLSMAKADSVDWIHGGHIALLCDNIPLAIERYQKANRDDLEYYINTETDLLLNAGISLDVITLALEVTKQKINS